MYKIPQVSLGEHNEVAEMLEDDEDYISKETSRRVAKSKTIADQLNR